MRTDRRSALAAVLNRVQAQLIRAWHWVGHQAAWVRWSLAVAAVATTVAAGYLIAVPETVSVSWIYHGRHFAPDDLEKIALALATKGIPTETSEGRLGVPTSRLVEAQDVIQKFDLGPVTVKDASRAPERPGFLDSPADIRQRDNHQRQRVLEAAIQSLDPTLCPTVSRYPSHKGSRTLVEPVDSVLITVYLKAADDRPIPPRTIEGIKNLAFSLEPLLQKDGLKLIDHLGRTYLDPQNPSLATRSQARVREEELTDEIHEQLSWITGVQVSVKLGPAPSPRRGPEPHAPAVIAPNSPLDLEAGTVEEPAQATLHEPAEAPAFGKVSVLVRVPISFYRNQFHNNGSTREPSPDDLKPYVTKTESMIRSAVAHVVSETEFGDLTIHRIEVPGLETTEVLSTQPEGRRGLGWLIPILGSAGAVLLVLAFASGLLVAARRPLPRAAAGALRRERFDRGEPSPSGPGPSERVRDLVRRDPDAAAGVLQRWIGQGGGSA